jgi:hypothetical protein
MSWHYQIRKRIIRDQSVFDIVEKYDNPSGWTVEGMRPFGISKKELIRDLEMMLADAKRYKVLVDNLPEVKQIWDAKTSRWIDFPQKVK